MREQRECILAGSRRGGRRTKKPPPENSGPPALTAHPSPDDARARRGTTVSSTQNDDGGGDEELSPSWQSPWSGGTPRESAAPYPQLGGATGGRGGATTQSAVDTTIAAADIQNPSDALEILAQVAGDQQADRSKSTIQSPQSVEDQRRVSSPERVHVNKAVLSSFPPFTTGAMSVPMIHHLFARCDGFLSYADRGRD